MNIRRCRDNRLQHGCSSLLLIWWSASELGRPSESFSILPVAHWHNPQGTRCWINMCLALLLLSLRQDPDQIWTESGVCLDRQRARSGSEPHVSFNTQHTSYSDDSLASTNNMAALTISCTSQWLAFRNTVAWCHRLLSIIFLTIVVVWHFLYCHLRTGAYRQNEPLPFPNLAFVLILSLYAFVVIGKHVKHFWVK